MVLQEEAGGIGTSFRVAEAFGDLGKEGLDGAVLVGARAQWVQVLARRARAGWSGQGGAGRPMAALGPGGQPGQ